MPATSSGRWQDFVDGGDGDRARVCDCLLENEEDKQWQAGTGDDGWRVTTTKVGQVPATQRTGQ